jgi:hypothetical protein
MIQFTKSVTGFVCAFALSTLCVAQNPGAGSIVSGTTGTVSGNSTTTPTTPSSTPTNTGTTSGAITRDAFGNPYPAALTTPPAPNYNSAYSTRSRSTSAQPQMPCAANDTRCIQNQNQCAAGDTRCLNTNGIPNR